MLDTIIYSKPHDVQEAKERERMMELRVKEEQAKKKKSKKKKIRTPNIFNNIYKLKSSPFAFVKIGGI